MPMVVIFIPLGSIPIRLPQITYNKNIQNGKVGRILGILGFKDETKESWKSILEILFTHTRTHGLFSSQALSGPMHARPLEGFW